VEAMATAKPPVVHRPALHKELSSLKNQ
jgi:hypothetical protein